MEGLGLLPRGDGSGQSKDLGTPCSAHRRPLVAAGGQTVEAVVELEEGTYLEVIVVPRLFAGASG